MASTADNSAVPASRGAHSEKVRDLVNREVIFCAAGVLAASPLTYLMCRVDSDVVVFCFAYPEDAGPLPSTSVGSGCRRAAGGDLKTGGRPERGPSSNPGMPKRVKRLIHVRAVRSCMPRRSAISCARYP